MPPQTVMAVGPMWAHPSTREGRELVDKWAYLLETSNIPFSSRFEVPQLKALLLLPLLKQQDKL